MIRRVSASSAEAFVMCGASHVLPQSDAHNDYQYRGTEGHAPLAAMVLGQAPEATARGLRSVAKFPFETVLAGVTNRETETAYVVNVKKRSVRKLGRSLDRNYGTLEPYEIPTTLDVQGLKDGRYFVRDWKFGRTSSWWQLWVQCMAVLYQGGDLSDLTPSEVDAGFIYIDGNTGGAEWRGESKIVGLEAMDEAADKLVAAWDRVQQMSVDLAAGKTLMTTEGEWCRYCGAYPHCPSKWNMAKHMLKTFQLEPSLDTLTPQELGMLWAKHQEWKRMLEKLADAIKGSAEVEPVPLPNGKQLVMIRTNDYQRIDKEKACALLREMGASKEQIASVFTTAPGYLTAKEVKGNGP